MGNIRGSKGGNVEGLVWKRTEPDIVQIVILNTLKVNMNTLL